MPRNAVIVVKKIGKIVQRWGIRPQISLLPAAGGFSPRPSPFRPYWPPAAGDMKAGEIRYKRRMRCADVRDVWCQRCKRYSEVRGIRTVQMKEQWTGIAGSNPVRAQFFAMFISCIAVVLKALW